MAQHDAAGCHNTPRLQHSPLSSPCVPVPQVPSWVTKRWLHYLSREFPTLAFHASLTNPFGKGALLSLLRQLARLRSDKQAVSVGFVGYPNVGKSSVINTLRTKKVRWAELLPPRCCSLFPAVLCPDDIASCHAWLYAAICCKLLPSCHQVMQLTHAPLFLRPSRCATTPLCPARPRCGSTSRS